MILELTEKGLQFILMGIAIDFDEKGRRGGGGVDFECTLWRKIYLWTACKDIEKLLKDKYFVCKVT